VVPWLEHRYELISWWAMAEFEGTALWMATSLLEQVAHVCVTRNFGEKKWGRVFNPHALEPKECSELLQLLEKIEMGLKASGLPVSASAVFDLRTRVSSSDILPVTSHAVIAGVDEVRNSIRREMSSHVFLYVDHDREKWHKDPRSGWEQAAWRFPNAIEEIEECSRCFALGRYGAAVFHVMLVAEVGAIEIGKLIGINDPKPGWPSTIREMTRIVRKAKWEELTSLEQQHRAFLEQLLSSMESMQSGWRHKISHVENKLVLMTGSFKPEVAEEIIVATRGFMRRLATEMP